MSGSRTADQRDSWLLDLVLSPHLRDVSGEESGVLCGHCGGELEVWRSWIL